MRRYLQTVLRSFYDFELYKDVYANWKGWAMGYTITTFALLLAIGITFGTFTLHHAVVADRADGSPGILEEGLTQIADQWPESRVEDNQLTTIVPGPHVIVIDMELFGEAVREEFITVDTSGATTYANMTTPVLITANEVIIKKDKGDGENETEIHSLKDFVDEHEQPFTLTSANMREFAHLAMDTIHQHAWKFYLFMGAFTWLLLVPVFLLVRLFLLIPLAVGGLIVATLMKRKLDYDAAVRIIAMVLVPLTIIEAFALIAFASGVSVWIKVLVSLGVLAAVLNSESKKL